MSVVDAAIAKGSIDTDRLYVTGGSGGGVLTAWIVGKTNRFRAAAAQKPVIDWTSEVLTVDMYSFMARYWFGKMPWEDPQAYWARSPLSLVGNVKTQWSSTSRMRGLRRRNLNSSIRHATPRRPITPDGCNEIAKR